MRLVASLALISALGVPAAAQTKAKPKPAAKPAASKAGPDRPSQLPATAPFVTVNGEKITVAQYIDRLSVSFAPQMREGLIEEVLVRQEAKKRNLKATGAEIDAAVNRVYAETLRRYGNEDRLRSELQRTRGWNLDDYKAVIREQATPQVLREKIAASLVKPDAIKDTDITEQYEENRAAYAVPDKVVISHILVRRPEGQDAAKDAAARAKAADLLKKAQAAGADFAKLAQASSEDQATAAKGGKIPIEIAKGSHGFGDAFEAAVFNADAGVVDEVVATPLGYHVVRVDTRKPGMQKTLEQVKGQIRDTLLAQRRQQAMDELFVQLRTKASVDTGRF